MKGAWLEQPVRRHRRRIDVGRFLLVDADDERCLGAHSRGACAEGTIDVVAMIEAVADHAVHQNDVEWLARLEVTLELAQIADDMGEAIGVHGLVKNCSLTKSGPYCPCGEP